MLSLSKDGKRRQFVLCTFKNQGKLLANEGRHRTGRSCLYLRSLADVDHDVLRELIDRSVAEMRRAYPKH